MNWHVTLYFAFAWMCCVAGICAFMKGASIRRGEIEEERLKPFDLLEMEEKWRSR